ncbi:uncharacterized protein BX663DRAFT_550627 [Cokeromyces recurvatus]|uniref:uncharacterized protein n=1 Tax=Cokeromyces recurvatus TaxID=90255 RepID=UPI0022200979|nr:uncharacterized protein BX663DRAFT_550627 [Cokeromyces recurvatus]KAI7904235.1 hypothetical protein BX663DRAFT_550627 [Cokeromyces recurvatus]
MMTTTTTTVKPTIKLPPRNNNNNKSCSTRTNMIVSSYDSQQITFSNKLFFEDMENEIKDYEIHHLLSDYFPYQIKRERGGGYLSFSDSEIAERVYSLFNGYLFQNQKIVKFKLSPDENFIQAEGPILEAKNLPNHINHNILYDIFRPFGPLSICKPVLLTADEKKGTQHALIQYFSKQDSDKAMNEINEEIVEGKKIQICASMMNNTFSIRYMNQSVSTPTYGTTTTENSNGYVDYTNLYVKNLDPTIDNTDLFNLFRKFGRIISARVMTHPQTNLSKGYGFVSFGKPEEAALALEEMNGYQFRTKPMIVAYHEPKKPRLEKSTSSTTNSFLPPSPTPISYNNVPYIESNHSHEVMNSYGINHIEPMNAITNNSIQRKVSIPNSNNSITPPHNPSMTSPQFAPRPSLASLASGATIQQTPPHPVIMDTHVRRRRGSMESINSNMTESSVQLQRHRITEAVKVCGSYGKQLPDIVDMILSLKRKERSICLFNPDFLKDKINAALEALNICEDDEEIEEEKQAGRESVVTKRDLSYNTTKPRTYTAIVSPPTSPSNKKTIIENVVIPPRTSKAIPIVAPLPDQDKKAEIKALLNSLEGKPIHEQKQLLGDQLFPLVKATGVKHAPKITIRLLDTVNLEVLANIMYDKESLMIHVNKAAFNL